MFTFQNIYSAYKDCRKHKRNTINQLNFKVSLIDNLWQLKNNLDSKNYKIGTRDYFFKGDKSKLAFLPPHKTLFKIPKSKRLPIGNLTSQFFANVYMNDFDNFVKRRLKVNYYIRYVDDFVLFDTSKERLESFYKEIEAYLWHNLALELRADTKLKKHDGGLDFLGYIIRENYILTRKRVVHNYKYKKAKYLEAYAS